ncbi:MAG TPA: hypothetical protein VNS32_09565 [Flavisolibacter sp.]|nr:hypothetical protein [Flavisolibacter sp.]
MKKKSRYTEDFHFETNLTKEDVIQKLTQYYTEIKTNEEMIELVRTPKAHHFLAVRGKAILQINDTVTDHQSILEGWVKPFIFFSRAGSFIFLILVAICSGIMLMFSFNTYILAGFILEWLLATIFAPYLLLACTFILMVLILANSIININTIVTIILAWLLTLWIIHLSLSFNKRQLKRYYTRSLKKALRAQ